MKIYKTKDSEILNRLIKKYGSINFSRIFKMLSIDDEIKQITKGAISGVSSLSEQTIQKIIKEFGLSNILVDGSEIYKKFMSLNSEQFVELFGLLGNETKAKITKEIFEEKLDSVLKTANPAPTSIIPDSTPVVKAPTSISKQKDTSKITGQIPSKKPREPGDATPAGASSGKGASTPVKQDASSVSQQATVKSSEKSEKDAVKALEEKIKGKSGKGKSGSGVAAKATSGDVGVGSAGKSPGKGLIPDPTPNSVSADAAKGIPKGSGLSGKSLIPDPQPAKGASSLKTPDSQLGKDSADIGQQTPKQSDTPSAGKAAKSEESVTKESVKSTSAKSTSEALKSTSDAPKATSEAPKSTSDAPKATSEAPKASSETVQPETPPPASRAANQRVGGVNNTDVGTIVTKSELDEIAELSPELSASIKKMMDDLNGNLNLVDPHVFQKIEELAKKTAKEISENEKFNKEDIIIYNQAIKNKIIDIFTTSLENFKSDPSVKPYLSGDLIKRMDKTIKEIGKGKQSISSGKDYQFAQIIANRNLSSITIDLAKTSGWRKFIAGISGVARSEASEIIREKVKNVVSKILTFALGGFIAAAGSVVTSIFALTVSILTLGANFIFPAAVVAGVGYLGYKYFYSENKEVAEDSTMRIAESSTNSMEVTEEYFAVLTESYPDEKSLKGVVAKQYYILEELSKLPSGELSEEQFLNVTKLYTQLTANHTSLKSVSDSIASNYPELSQYHDKMISSVESTIQSLNTLLHISSDKVNVPEKVGVSGVDVIKPETPTDSVVPDGEVFTHNVYGEEVDISNLPSKMRMAVPYIVKLLNLPQSKALIDPENKFSGGFLSKSGDNKKDYLEAIKFFYNNNLSSERKINQFIRNNIPKVSKKGYFQQAFDYYRGQGNTKDNQTNEVRKQEKAEKQFERNKEKAERQLRRNKLANMLTSLKTSSLKNFTQKIKNNENFTQNLQKSANYLNSVVKEEQMTKEADFNKDYVKSLTKTLSDSSDSATNEYFKTLKKQLAGPTYTKKEKKPDYSEYYGVIENSKIIETAHPKSIQIADAKANGGIVENGLEQHRKMEEIALSMPTGNFTNRYASVLNTLVKIANIADDEGDLMVSDLIDEAAKKLSNSIK